MLDNASEDGSADAVRERFPDVRVIAQQFRAGFGANHNTVIRATTRRYVYVLNEDTTSDDWALRADGRPTSTHIRASPRSARGSSIPDGPAAGLGVAFPDAAGQLRSGSSRSARRA